MFVLPAEENNASYKMFFSPTVGVGRLSTIRPEANTFLLQCKQATNLK